MSKRSMVRAALVSMTCVAVFLPSAAAAATPLDFDFESPTQASGAFTPGSCHAPTWLAANGPAVSQSGDQKSEGSFGLAHPIHMTGGSFDQAGVDCVLPDPRPADLTPYAAVTFDVYAPTAGLKADLIFNDPWHPSSSPLRDLSAGWNTLSYDISSTSADFPGGQQEGKDFILRLVGQGVTFTGTAYFDNVRFAASTNPTVSVLAPKADDTIATPPGGRYTIRATATPGEGRTITAVRWTAGRQSGSLSHDAGSGEWTGGWDSWAGGEGVRTVSVQATDSEGGETSVPVTVLVQNSGLRVEPLSPAFDSVLKGRVRVSARVKEDPRFDLRSVKLVAGRLQVGARLGRPGGDGWRSATFELDSRRLSDGVQTLNIVAADRRFRVEGEIDVMVRNRDEPWGVVRARGTRFLTEGGPFSFVGSNEYELFTRVDKTNAHVQETLSGRVIPKNATIPWREQIDRQLLEAARNRLTVLRTWAFDDNDEDIAFQRKLGEYNEATFRKLDYIMDSARRHRIRVILTFTNYWGDYGGIGRYTEQLGLANKNQFFTDGRARLAYEAYVEHLVKRVNTVNGTPYKHDPTLFAWELMNEPRTDCADDPTPDKRYCDATGQTLRTWTANESAYVKSLDRRHMVAAGAEAHGLVQTQSGPFQWARDDEGGGNDPWKAQDVPSTDFLTFHPYPNASWAQYTFAQTHALLTGLTRTGVARGKPVVMSEYGIHRSQPITDRAGNKIAPDDPSFNAMRLDWHRMLLADCYRNGCAGSNLWMIADWSDPELNVNLYMPKADALRDAPLVALLRWWGERLERR